jgi:diguanylate cyclase (GGDEF)-like protein
MSRIRRCVGTPYCWVVLLVIWTQLVAGSAVWSLHSIEAHARDTITQRGRDLFRIIQFARRWNARHGGVYVVASAKAPPNPYLVDESRDLQTRQGLELTMINPAYMTRQISEFARDEGFYFHITSNKPIRPANAPDTWERKALEAFEQGVTERVDLVRSDAHAVYRYMAPLLVKPSCLGCHSEQGYEVGDIRGGISVNIAADETLAMRDQQMWMVGGTHLAVWLVVGFLIYFAMSNMRRQLALMNSDLATQRQTINEGQEALRAAQQKISALQDSDQLTGLLSRHQFQQRLQEALDRAEVRQRRIGVMFIEIDNFQAFNESHGVIEGDAALRSIADTLRRALSGQRCLLGRYVGTAFAAALADREDIDLDGLAETVREAVLRLGIGHAVDDQRFLTVSVGVTSQGGAPMPQSADLLNHMAAAMLRRRDRRDKVVRLDPLSDQSTAPA